MSLHAPRVDYHLSTMNAHAKWPYMAIVTALRSSRAPGTDAPRARLHYSASAPSLDVFQSIPPRDRAEPFVKWSGGKKRLLAAFDPLFPAHFESYHEPFLGGGAVFLFLRSVGRVRRGVLSDSNGELVHLWRTVRDDVDRLIVALERLPYDRDVYYSVREQDPAELEPVARAVRTLYLNRTCFNGLYRINQSGRFNVPFGRYDNPVVCNGLNLRNVSRLLQGIEIQRWSFDVVADLARPGDFVYLDPPHHPVIVASEGEGTNDEGFDARDHARLRDVYRQLDQRGALLMLSIPPLPGLRELYRGFAVSEVTSTRATGAGANRRTRGTDLVIRNFS